ncbi:MAG: hypothetical protein RR386_03270 [Bacteroidaceae bacterium]
MSIRNTEKSAYAQRIQMGLAIANRKMMETAAAMGRNLIICRPGEKWQEVDARKLLEDAKQSDWWKTHFE